MKRILIADDKESSRELVREVLEPLGCIIEEAVNGIQAVDLVRASPPDLVLLDIHMPLMDGFAVVRELRRDPRSAAIPIIALTASAMQGQHERALAAGFSDFITKPVSLSELRSRIRAHLQANV